MSESYTVSWCKTNAVPHWVSPDGSILLVNADCLDVLPTIPKGTVDAVVTDPPYGIGADKRGAHSSIRDDGAWPDSEWDNERPSESLIRSLPTLAPASAIWGGNYFADLLPPRAGWLIWRKPEAETGFSLADAELCWTSTQNAVRVVSLPRRDGHDHPTQKPVRLMEWSMDRLGVEPGAVVLDPFAGSFTTGVACVRTGRRFIGCEIEPRYFEIAVKRIERALRDKEETFEIMRPEAKAIQGAMFE